MSHLGGGTSALRQLHMPLQLRWQSAGLKNPASLVQFQSEAPTHIPLSYIGQYAVLIRPLWMVQVHLGVPIYTCLSVVVCTRACGSRRNGSNPQARTMLLQLSRQSTSLVMKRSPVQLWLVAPEPHGQLSKVSTPQVGQSPDSCAEHLHKWRDGEEA